MVFETGALKRNREMAGVKGDSRLQKIKLLITYCKCGVKKYRFQAVIYVLCNSNVLVSFPTACFITMGC
jgi:hypothetical protein